MEKVFVKKSEFPNNSMFIRHNMGSFLDGIRNGRTPMNMAEEAWRVRLDRVKNQFYAFQIVDGRIIDAYTVEDAVKNTEHNRVNIKLSNTVPERIKREFVGKYIKLENQNPIQYN